MSKLPELLMLLFSMSTPIGLNGARPITYLKNHLDIVLIRILVYAYFLQQLFRLHVLIVRVCGTDVPQQFFAYHCCIPRQVRNGQFVLVLSGGSISHGPPRGT
jgi:hypothetical protein